MEKKDLIVEWIKRSKQREAIVRSIRKPMTASEICEATRKYNVSLWITDIPRRMREFQKQGLTYVINPDYVNGKLYYLTDKGKKIVSDGFGISLNSLPQDIDWKKYSKVARSKMKKMVLIGLANGIKLSDDKLPGSNSSMVKRYLKDKYPISLNNTIDSLKELVALRLTKCVGVTKKRNLKLYQLTRQGWIIYRQLVK